MPLAPKKGLRPFADGEYPAHGDGRYTAGTGAAGGKGAGKAVRVMVVA